MTTLKPCPFCGGRAELSLPTCRPTTPYNPRDRLYPVVRCTACWAEAFGANEDYKGSTAVESWNRRAPEVGDDAREDDRAPLDWILARLAEAEAHLFRAATRASVAHDASLYAMAQGCNEAAARLRMKGEPGERER